MIRPHLLAHGGTAGLALELAVLLVPLLCILILVWWGKRHSRPGQDVTATDLDREGGAP